MALPIRDAIYYCREQPASDWPEAVCLLIGRQDLSKQACEGNLQKGKSVSMGINGFHDTGHWIEHSVQKLPHHLLMFWASEGAEFKIEGNTGFTCM